MRLTLLAVLLMAGCRPVPAPVDAGEALDAGDSDASPALARLVARFGGLPQVDGLDPELRRVRAALRSGRLRIDAAALERCLTREARLTFAQVLAGACEGVFVGTTPLGGACDTGLACADGFCSRKFGAQCGVCAAGMPVGEACDFSSRTQRCVRGAECLGGRCTVSLPGPQCSCSSCTSSGECLTGPGDAGAACLRDVDCQRGLLCAARVCTRGVDGVLCGSDGDRCAEGFVCNGERFQARCAPKRAANESCTWSAQCPGGFICAQGLCRLAMGPGAPCSEPTTACMEGTTCVGGRCSRRPHQREACIDGCAYSDCRAGLCVSRSAGADCSVFDEHPDGPASCGEGLASDGAACVRAPVAGESCETTACDEGTECVEQRCEAFCVLGDGEAHDDFVGPTPLVRRDAGCALSGPAEQVIPLTPTQARCAFGTSLVCAGCHSVTGCWELRPQGVPAPPAGTQLSPACGIDAGR